MKIWKLTHTIPLLNDLKNCETFIHSSMALQPFVGPWPLLRVRNLFYTDRRTLRTSDQPVSRQLPTHRTTQTQNKRKRLEWDSNPRSKRSSEDSSCLRTRGHRDQRTVRLTGAERHVDLFAKLSLKASCPGRFISGERARRYTD
jgi:hypothetical protein